MEAHKGRVEEGAVGKDAEALHSAWGRWTGGLGWVGSVWLRYELMASSNWRRLPEADSRLRRTSLKFLRAHQDVELYRAALSHPWCTKALLTPGKFDISEVERRWRQWQKAELGTML